MIFLTVGTQFPFDRMVKAIDRFAKNIDEEIYAQIGESSYKPANFKAVQKMNSRDFEKYIQSANAIISHSGMGTLETALRYEKPLLAVPRMKKFGEVVNDHQVAIAKRFETEGYILAAYDENEIGKKTFLLKKFRPKKRLNSCDAVAEKIIKFLQIIEND